MSDEDRAFCRVLIEAGEMWEARLVICRIVSDDLARG